MCPNQGLKLQSLLPLGLPVPVPASALISRLKFMRTVVVVVVATLHIYTLVSVVLTVACQCVQ